MNCRHAGVCGGCSLLDLSYGDQLARKELELHRLLAAALEPFDAVWPRDRSVFLPTFASEDSPSHFRQKVSFVFAPDPSGRGLLMGHYRRGSNRVVSVDECPVHSERGNRIAFALKRELDKSGESVHAVLRHLIVRVTADEREAVAMLVVTENTKALRRPVRALLDSPDSPDGFFMNINTSAGPFMVGERTLKVEGRSHVRDVVGGVSYLISPTAFFQTNVAAAATMQRHVVESTARANRVLDLYCGSGLFSLPLAMQGVRVTGVEENRQAIVDADANARLNRIASSRVRFMTARVEDAVRHLARDSWDGVILDPPRQGCSDDVLEAVFQEMAPPSVTYVSCNPAALAQELGGIIECGYRPTQIAAVDMFPHTDHLEVILQLTRH
jgi:23S rRNA (uracil1939-C5)-methyltransferase